MFTIVGDMVVRPKVFPLSNYSYQLFHLEYFFLASSRSGRRIGADETRAADARTQTERMHGCQRFRDVSSGALYRAGQRTGEQFEYASRRIVRFARQTRTTKTFCQMSAEP